MSRAAQGQKRKEKGKRQKKPWIWRIFYEWRMTIDELRISTDYFNHQKTKTPRATKS